MTQSLTQAFIFDMDGTIIDSMHAFADIASEVMPKYYDISHMNARQKYLETSGIPFFQQLEKLYPNHTNNDRTANEFETIKETLYLDKGAFSDAHDTLTYLRNNHVLTIVSSNNFQSLVDAHIEKLQLPFDMILGFKPGFAKGIDHFNYIQTQFSLKKNHMTFIGDSIQDGVRAHDYGMTFIGKTGTFSRNAFLKKFPNDIIIDSLSELKLHIKG